MNILRRLKDRFSRRGLREYDVVHVVRLATPERPYSGSREPRVGDVGTILHEYGEGAAPVIVERVGKGGSMIRLADFERDELELVERP